MQFFPDIDRMKFFARLFVLLLVLAGIVLAGRFAILAFFPRSQPPPDIAIEGSDRQIDRGRYLFNNVTACVGCHSEFDTRYAGYPVRPGTEGKGGMAFDLGDAGVVYASNITPTAMDAWTDGELRRAISSGVDKDGEPLSPIMPYHQYAMLSLEDLDAVVAYIRTLEPLPNDVPERQLEFPMDLMVRFMPKVAEPTAETPDARDRVLYGEYLTFAACVWCHTPGSPSRKLEERILSGGVEFPVNDTLIVRSSNLTPDSTTGIGSWTLDQFIGRFKRRGAIGDSLTPADPNETVSPMPWSLFAGMTDDDLTAIYEYLRIIPPAVNDVEPYVRVGD